MPEAHDHVDLQVLEEVERVLTSTSFATIDDLAGRLDVGDPSTLAARAPVARRATGVIEPALLTGEPVAPLPRRR